ncbi:TlpA family protein disulfide reductase [Paenibacillus sp. Dod16]|uniref:TlpA family protein disulfide reductase n=1 Tax=Paenibacillus sp. Dod16 TaxID=3416392 RepID=UPI003CF09E03
MNKQKLVQIPMLLLIIVFFVIMVLGLREDRVVTGIGEAGYDFKLEDLKGNVHQLSDYKGKVVVINIFATWCEPCVDEAPELEAFEQNYNNEAKLLILDKGEPKDRVAKFIEKHKTTSTYLFDFDNQVSEKYGVRGQPETFILDKEGIIRQHIIGTVNNKMLAEAIQPWI